jgi:hypothetical protein
MHLQASIPVSESRNADMLLLIVMICTCVNFCAIINLSLNYSFNFQDNLTANQCF